jgi:death-on-curing protein
VRRAEPVWIVERVVLAAHFRLLAVHGGAGGLCDLALLKSALAGPRQHYANRSAELVELAALYTAGLVRNHPFVDGNKRTGFVIGVAFLELNGFVFRASEEDAIQAVLTLAADKLDQTGYAAWLRLNVRRKR